MLHLFSSKKEPQEDAVVLDESLKRKLSNLTDSDVFTPCGDCKSCTIRYSYIGAGLIGLKTTDIEKLLPFFKQSGIECSTLQIREGMQEYSDNIVFHDFTDKKSLVDTIKSLPGIREMPKLK